MNAIELATALATANGTLAAFDVVIALFFLKFVPSPPDVTAFTPVTSQAKNMADNLGAAVGRLPTAEQRRRMIELVDPLPPAPQQSRG